MMFIMWLIHMYPWITILISLATRGVDGFQTAHFSKIRRQQQHPAARKNWIGNSNNNNNKNTNAQLVVARVPSLNQQPSFAARDTALFGSSNLSDDETVTETTRIPIGELFSDRRYIFRTTKNIRGYEWETKEVEELWEDLKDSAFPKTGKEVEDFELQQVVLAKAEWNKKELGNGGRYDIHDGQQRIITLTLLLAAIRDSLRGEDDEEEAIHRLQQCLYHERKRKGPLFRIEPREREASMLRRILRPNGADAIVVEEKITNEDNADPPRLTTTSSYRVYLGTLKERKRLTVVDQRIATNYETLLDFVNELSCDNKVDFFDYIEENVFLLVTTAGTPRMARNMVMGQGKGKNNEAIDDFKGMVCFGFINAEADQEQVFTKWDDLYDECGRKTVVDACVLLASAELQQRVKKNDELNLLDKWIRWHLDRDDGLEGGVDFFNKIMSPACKKLHYFRTERFDLACDLPDDGYAAIRTKMRLKFLRSLSKVPTCKDIEGVVLYQLVRPWADFSAQLLDSERLAIWMTLTKQTPTRRHQRGVLLLNQIFHNEQLSRSNLISSDEFALIRKQLDEEPFGAKSSKIIVATALLERLNSELLLLHSESAMPECMALQLEHILPKKAVGEYWERHWPASGNKREEWTHRLGNLALLNQKLNVKASNRSFSSKKDVYKKSPYPLTKHLIEQIEWNAEAIQIRHLQLLHQTNEVWGL